MNDTSTKGGKVSDDKKMMPDGEASEMSANAGADESSDYRKDESK